MREEARLPPKIDLDASVEGHFIGVPTLQGQF